MSALKSSASEIIVNNVPIEYRLAAKMVIFCAGFGVRYDSPTMSMSIFKDIAASLPTDIGYARFSFCRMEGTASRIFPLSEEIKLLQGVVDWVRSNVTMSKLALIGHSQGCIDIACASLTAVDCVVMLAPPDKSGYPRKYHTAKPGAVMDRGEWHIPRSDGVPNLISDQVFDEDERITPYEAINRCAMLQRLYLIAAGGDSILGDQSGQMFSANSNIERLVVPGASHDFQGESRKELVELVAGLLNKNLCGSE